MTYVLWHPVQWGCKICANYAFEDDILFNRSKSVWMVVKPRGRNVNGLKM